MTHTVKYKLFPNEGDVEMPECYVNAYHTVCDSRSMESVEEAWKRITGSTLKLTDNMLKVTFATEADELFFRLRYS